jgi:hypothetical protein
MSDDAPSPIGIETAAKLIMVDQRHVQRLSVAGYIPKPYTVVGVVHGYIKHLKDSHSRTADQNQRSKVQEARSREIEQRIAIKNRDLVPQQDALDAMDSVCGLIRSELQGYPSAFTRDRDLRRRLEDGIEAILRRVAERLAEQARALATGQFDPDPADEADAGRLGEDESALST